MQMVFAQAILAIIQIFPCQAQRILVIVMDLVENNVTLMPAQAYFHKTECALMMAEN
jgi:hypothetical protein